MPTYVYRCAKCGEQIEAFQSFSDKPLTKHTDCGGKLTKVLSAAGIVLKGSGFYKTDNREGSSKGPSAEFSSLVPKPASPIAPTAGPSVSSQVILSRSSDTDHDTCSSPRGEENAPYFPALVASS